ncbi:MAG: hypothetical protein ACEQSB_01335 [Undibacterium sp.]
MAARTVDQRLDHHRELALLEDADRVLRIDGEACQRRLRQFAVPLQLASAGGLEQLHFVADVVVRVAILVAEDLLRLVPAPRPLGVADDVDLVSADREVVALFADAGQDQDLAMGAVLAVQVREDVTRAQAGHGAVQLAMGHGHVVLQ